MTSERYAKLLDAAWVVEIQLDSATCDDGGEDDVTKEITERLLVDATRLRKLIQRNLAPEAPDVSA
jgi:hypothetical protein